VREKRFSYDPEEKKCLLESKLVNLASDKLEIPVLGIDWLPRAF
jgi:hypothetical protein